MVTKYFSLNTCHFFMVETFEFPSPALLSSYCEITHPHLLLLGHCNFCPLAYISQPLRVPHIPQPLLSTMLPETSSLERVEVF